MSSHHRRFALSPGARERHYDRVARWPHLPDYAPSRPARHHGRLAPAAASPPAAERRRAGPRPSPSSDLWLYLCVAGSLVLLLLGHARSAYPQPLVLESTLEPALSAQVHAQQGGAVSQVRVASGDPVFAGDTLACLDARAWQLQAEIAHLDLAQAQSRLGRVRPLYAQGGISTQDLEQLEHQVRLAELRVQEADLVLTAAALTSPLTGVVAAVAIAPGQHVAAGYPCLVVIDPADLQAQLYVPVDRYGQVRPGQPVAAEYLPDPADDPALAAIAPRSPAPPARPTLRGRLIRVAPTTEPGTDQCLAVARFPGAGRHYPPGTHVRVTLNQE